MYLFIFHHVTITDRISFGISVVWEELSLSGDATKILNRCFALWQICCVVKHTRGCNTHADGKSMLMHSLKSHFCLCN